MTTKTEGREEKKSKIERPAGHLFISLAMTTNDRFVCRLHTFYCPFSLFPFALNLKLNSEIFGVSSGAQLILQNCSIHYLFFPSFSALHECVYEFHSHKNGIHSVHVQLQQQKCDYDE